MHSAKKMVTNSCPSSLGELMNADEPPLLNKLYSLFFDIPCFWLFRSLSALDAINRVSTIKCKNRNKNCSRYLYFQKITIIFYKFL